MVRRLRKLMWWARGGNVSQRPPLHLRVVAIEKGAFWSSSTMVANFTLTGPLALWLECSPMVQETRVQSQVESYQTLKKNLVFDAALLSTQHYKVRIKGKVEQSRERSSALPYTLVY